MQKVELVFRSHTGHPYHKFAGLVEEVGEVGRLLNHLYGDKPKKQEEATQELGGDLADVLYGLICIANRHNVDLDIEMEKVIKKATVRDGARFEKKWLCLRLNGQVKTS